MAEFMTKILKLEKNTVVKKPIFVYIFWIVNINSFNYTPTWLIKGAC